MSEDKNISIKIETESTLQPSYGSLYRVSVETDSISVLLSHSISGQVVASAVLVMPASTVRMNQDVVLPYYERLIPSFPTLKPAAESSFGLQNPTVYYGTFLDFAHYGELGQVSITWVDMRKVAAIQKGQMKKDIPAGRTVAIFDMPLPVQLGIIHKLYMGI